MATRVRLRDIMDGVEAASDTCTAFLDLLSGKVEWVDEDDDLEFGEECELGEVPEWQRDCVLLARQIQDNPERFLALPTPFDFHEYRHMERFALSLQDRQLSDELYYAIKGRGAFGRFKGLIHERGVSDEWYQYREERLRELAIEWCKDNHIDYTDESPERP